MFYPESESYVEVRVVEYEGLPISTKGEGGLSHPFSVCIEASPHRALAFLRPDFSALSSKREAVVFTIFAIGSGLF